MKTNSKNAKLWTGGSILLLSMVGGLWLFGIHLQQPYVSHDVDVTLVSPSALPQYFQSISIPCWRIIKKYNLEGDDILLLDFSYPNDASYGDKPQYEVFNPLSGDATPPTQINDIYKKYADNPQIIFTLGNKVEGLGSDKAEIVAIMPRVHEDICESIHKKQVQGATLEIPTASSAPNLTPYPTIVDRENIYTLPSRHGCIKTPSGFYYYRALIER